ncbi:hypothetical protein ACJZ2D_016149 [Fusarium nematophilum]
MAPRRVVALSMAALALWGVDASPCKPSSSLALSSTTIATESTGLTSATSNAIVSDMTSLSTALSSDTASGSETGESTNSASGTTTGTQTTGSPSLSTSTTGSATVTISTTGSTDASAGTESSTTGTETSTGTETFTSGTETSTASTAISTGTETLTGTETTQTATSSTAAQSSTTESTITATSTSAGPSSTEESSIATDSTTTGSITETSTTEGSSTTADTSTAGDSSTTTLTSTIVESATTGHTTTTAPASTTTSEAPDCTAACGRKGTPYIEDLDEDIAAIHVFEDTEPSFAACIGLCHTTPGCVSFSFLDGTTCAMWTKRLEDFPNFITNYDGIAYNLDCIDGCDAEPSTSADTTSAAASASATTFTTSTAAATTTTTASATYDSYSCAETAPVDAVVNGGFEVGAQEPWTSTSGIQYAVKEIDSNGFPIIIMFTSIPGPGITESISQPVSGLDTSTEYTLRFLWGVYEANNLNGGDCTIVAKLGGTEITSIRLHQGNFALDESISGALASKDFVPHASEGELSLEISCAGNNNHGLGLFFDNVSLLPKTADTSLTCRKPGGLYAISLETFPIMTSPVQTSRECSTLCRATEGCRSFYLANDATSSPSFSQTCQLFSQPIESIYVNEFENMGFWWSLDCFECTEPSNPAPCAPPPDSVCGTKAAMTDPIYVGFDFNSPSLESCYQSCKTTEKCNSFSYDGSACSFVAYTAELSDVGKPSSPVLYDMSCFKCGPPEFPSESYH